MSAHTCIIRGRDGADGPQCGLPATDYRGVTYGRVWTCPGHHAAGGFYLSRDVEHSPDSPYLA
jgi:hypothetical protein